MVSKIGESQPAGAPLLSRRNFLKLGGMMIPPGLVTGLLAHQNAQSVLFRRESLRLSGIPPELTGLRILFETDHHIGGNINGIATQVSAGTQALLDGSTPENTIVLHGGDFVSEKTYAPATSRADMQEYAPTLFRGLDRFHNTAVMGNHDANHPEFQSYFRGMLEGDHNIQFLEKPDQVGYFPFNNQTVAIHGIHTLGNYLRYIPKEKRDEILDEFIDTCNTGAQSLNIVLIHSPDGLQYVLDRLKETGKTLTKKTIFFAGHTHGGMIDIPIIRQIGLHVCHLEFDRHKGWYYPEGEDLGTGDWSMYVSTGIGNSPYHALRMNAPPEVVCFQIQSV